MNKDPIAIVIATSKGRTKLLYSRSLRSVYKQEGVNPLEVVIVDDNPVAERKDHSGEYMKIKDAIESLRNELLRNTYERFLEYTENVSFDEFFKTTLIKNSRTRGHSGTGAWNTAIYYLAKKYPKNELFVAILDDDDEYMGGYLSECSKIIKNNGDRIVAVFPFIKWRRSEGDMVLEFKREDITPRSFFIGDPGIQGSNMCIKLDLLKDVGGFDENLYSATDRDLMIRLLNHMSNSKQNLEIYLIPKPMVIYHTDQPDRVTNNRHLKKLGLDVFYEKWRDDFSEKDFVKSLDRARRLFGYEFESS